MNSLRTRFTIAFGTLLILLLGITFLVIDHQIQKTYDEQVRQTTEEMRVWTEYAYGQISELLVGPLTHVVQTDEDVLRSVRSGHTGVRPDSPLDILEYGTTSGRILYSDWNLREGRVSEYHELGKTTLALWQERLAVLRTLPIESGGNPFGFVTGGYWLREHLAAFVPPGGTRLFLRQGTGTVSSLQGDALSTSEQISLLTGQQADLGGTPYRVAHLPLDGDLGSIIVAIPRTAVDAQRNQLRNLLLVLSAISVVATYGSSYLVARTLTRPIEVLAKGAWQIAGGDLSIQLDVRSRDEVGLLTEQFNQMVSQLQALQQKLLHAERVAVWRDMARMMAHEIKNPLFPIQLSIENLQRCRERNPAMLAEIFDECTQTVLEEVAKLRRIVDEFRQFARLPSPDFQQCQVNEVVSQSLRLYSAMPETVSMQSNLDPSIPVIDADPQQLGQVFQNLIKNAVEAMHEGGKLSVHTYSIPGNMIHSEEHKQGAAGQMKHAAGNHRWICVQLADTGVGMSEEVRASLFKPYFTTKDKGTGLGMAIVERIVREHDGQIDVQSEPGEGTRITVSLPEQRVRSDESDALAIDLGMSR